MGSQATSRETRTPGTKPLRKELTETLSFVSFLPCATLTTQPQDVREAAGAFEEVGLLLRPLLRRPEGQHGRRPREEVGRVQCPSNGCGRCRAWGGCPQHPGVRQQRQVPDPARAARLCSRGPRGAVQAEARDQGSKDEVNSDSPSSLTYRFLASF